MLKFYLGNAYLVGVETRCLTLGILAVGMRVSASQAGIISLCVYSNASNIENLTTKPCFFVYLRFDAAMERRHLQQATGGGASLRNLAPPARSISGGRKPPRPTTSTPSKKQRQSFVAPLPRPTAPPGGGLHQPSTGGGQHPLPGGAPGGFLPWQGNLILCNLIQCNLIHKMWVLLYLLAKYLIQLKF